jgi:hypothetical protein
MCLPVTPVQFSPTDDKCGSAAETDRAESDEAERLPPLTPPSFRKRSPLDTRTPSRRPSTTFGDISTSAGLRLVRVGGGHRITVQDSGGDSSTFSAAGTILHVSESSSCRG